MTLGVIGRAGTPHPPPAPHPPVCPHPPAHPVKNFLWWVLLVRYQLSALNSQAGARSAEGETIVIRSLAWEDHDQELGFGGP